VSLMFYGPRSTPWAVRRRRQVDVVCGDRPGAHRDEEDGRARVPEQRCRRSRSSRRSATSAPRSRRSSPGGHVTVAD